MKDIEVVVARYNENVDWLLDLPYKVSCVIYNKGDRATLSSLVQEKFNVVDLPNVGREAHTYLYHIVNNFDKLARITVFTQGRYSDHTENTSFEWFFDTFCKTDLFSKNLIDPRVWGGVNSAHRNFNIREYCNQFIANKNNWTLGQWWEATFECPYEEIVQIYPNAIFSMNKDMIINKEIDLYKKLLDQVSYDVHPVEAHFLERSWFFLFTNYKTQEKTQQQQQPPDNKLLQVLGSAFDGLPQNSTQGLDLGGWMNGKFEPTFESLLKNIYKKEKKL